VREIASQIEPFHLPLFDSEGNRCGNKISCEVDILTPNIEYKEPWFNFNLNRELFKY
jgi:hypothetical protein